MARYTSEAKGGYYATPPSQMALVIQRLTFFPQSEINIFDPCCGEGNALKQLADAASSKGAVVKSYGIELEQERSRIARRVLDRVLYAGYETVRMSQEGMSLMWLNPPYNTVSGERVEVRFLRDLSDAKRLQPGGILLFCIPQNVLENAASLLASRYQNIRVYRFEDEFFMPYRQVIVFACRRDKAESGKAAWEMRSKLEYLSKLGPDGLPILSVNDGFSYQVPPAARAIELFRDSSIDPVEVKDQIPKSKAMQKMLSLIVPAAHQRIKMNTPILPLKEPHLGTLIVSGAVGGNMGGVSGEDAHIVKGLTKRVTEVDYKGEKNEAVAVTENMQISLRVYTQDGVFNL